MGVRDVTLSLGRDLFENMDLDHLGHYATKTNNVHLKIQDFKRTSRNTPVMI